MAADVADDVANGSIPAVGYAWRKDPEDGWWSYDAGDSKLLSGVQFRFSTAADSSELAPEIEIVPGADNLLQQILLSTIDLRVGRGARWSSLAQALESVDNPLPKLENLEIESSTEEEVVDCLLKGIECQRISGLRCLTFESIANESESWLERLEHLIRAHRFPLLFELSLKSKFGQISNRAVESFIASLVHLTTLGSLRIHGQWFGTGHRALAELMESGHLHNLQTLDLTYTSVEIVSCKAYAKALREGHLPALRELNLSENHLGEKGGEALGGALGSISFRELEILDMRSCLIGDRSASALAIALGSGHLKSLNSLVLTWNSIGDDGMVDLAFSFDKIGLPKLRSLDVRLNEFRGRGAEALAAALRQGRLPALQELNLSWNDLGEEGGEALGDALSSISVRELEVLNMGDCKIGDRGAAALAIALGSGHLKSLNALVLRFNCIDDKGVVDLVSSFDKDDFPKLSSLDVGGNKFRGRGAEALAKALRKGRLPALWELNLSCTIFAEEGGEALGGALDSINFRELEILDMEDCRIGDRGAVALATALSSGHLKSLNTLVLRCNCIGDDGMVDLASSFNKIGLPNLRSLDVGLNEFRGRGGMALATALRQGRLPALRELDLHQNHLGEKGGEALGDALGSISFRELEILDMGKCKIGDRGAVALATALGSGHLKSLNSLVVWDNDISDDGMVDLASSFGKIGFPKLRSLDVGGNKLRGNCAEALATALKSGHLNYLKDLSIYSNDRTGSKVLAEAIVSAYATNTVLCVQIEDYWLWAGYPELEERYRHLLKRNGRIAKLLVELGGERAVAAQFSKVYLCGQSLVGKTTLSKSLKRSFWQALWAWLRRRHPEPRTRGIQVSRLIDRKQNGGEVPLTLLLWDMAGQDEYHLVHNAFLPELTLAGGKASSFVAVCTSDDDKKAEQELKHWFQFIASNCGKNRQNRRGVVVVVNCLRGNSDVHKRSREWELRLGNLSRDFGEYLEIHPDPFMVDVRKRSAVQKLKRHVIQNSRRMLEDQLVPEICQSIQQKLPNLCVDKARFPVLHWDDFVKTLDSDPQGSKSAKNQSTRMIEAATKYLNEAGVVIYINPEFPSEWKIPTQKLVVVDPNWICNQVVGKMLLSDSLANSGEAVLRDKVDEHTGSVPLSGLVDSFKFLGEWGKTECNDLLTILLWLGLCYKGREENVIIPALIRGNRSGRECWGPGKSVSCERGQWVMGYAVKRMDSEITLAPIAVWHRFQVDLAQTPGYNGKVDNEFLVGKYFVNFKFEQMSVLIEVDASQDRPTFDRISMVVKPLLPARCDDLDSSTRKGKQVDVASALVERLVNLWMQVCPGVGYVRQVLRPRPALSAPGLDEMKMDVDVEEMKKWVQEHGVGRLLNWTVGEDTICGDQLLSTKDKKELLLGVRSSLDVLRDGVREAVELGIIPREALHDRDGAEVSKSTSAQRGAKRSPAPCVASSSHPAKKGDDEGLGDLGTSSRIRTMKEDGVNEKLDNISKQEELHLHLPREIHVRSPAPCVASSSHPAKSGNYEGSGDVESSVIRADIRRGFEEMGKDIEVVRKDIGVVRRELADIRNVVVTNASVTLQIKETMIKHDDMLRRVLDVGDVFLHANERKCPSFVYLGGKDSSAWTTLKEAMSPVVTVHLHFACEANYDGSGLHRVENQQGIDVRRSKHWFRKISPCLKVTITALSISAKVAANLIAPGTGILIPFPDWEEMKSLSDSIVSATGYTEEKLHELAEEEISLEDGTARRSFQELHRESRRAMAELLEKLSSNEFEEKLGLHKVLLRRKDGSTRRVSWICRECYDKYKAFDLVIDFF